MAKKPETAFKEKVLSDLEELHKVSPCYFEKIQQVSIRGTPDIIGCLRGMFIALELKREGAHSRGDEFLQNYKLDRYKLAGGISLVVYPSDWKVLYKALEDFANTGTFTFQEQQIWSEAHGNNSSKRPKPPPPCKIP